MQGYGGGGIATLPAPPPPPAPTAGPALLSPSSQQSEHQMRMRETGRPPQAGLPNWLFLRDLRGFPRQVSSPTALSPIVPQHLGRVQKGQD